MLFAGAIDVPAEVVFAVLAIALLGALLFAATGGALAWALSGRRSSFWLGSLALAGTVIGLARVMDPTAAVLAGYAASAAVGILTRRAAPN